MTIKEAKKELKEIIRYTKRRDDYAADCVPVELLEAILDYVSKQEAKINDYKQRCESAEERYTTLVRTAAESVEKKTKAAKTDVLNELKERIKTAIDTYFNLDGGGYYLAEDAIDDIDELIKEIEK